MKTFDFEGIAEFAETLQKLVEMKYEFEVLKYEFEVLMAKNERLEALLEAKDDEILRLKQGVIRP